MTSKRKPLPTQLRRSISEQLRDSTARAWDLLWRNVRERRLAGRCPRQAGAARREAARGASRTLALRRAVRSRPRTGAWAERAAHSGPAAPAARPARPAHPARRGAVRSALRAR